MTQLFLRPQWCFRTRQSDGWCLLTSENFHQTMPPEFSPLLNRLVDGLDPTTLTDAEYTQIEDLNGRGFISISKQPHAPAWELAGANYQIIQEQFKHVTFYIECSTDFEEHASIIEKILIESGLTRKNYGRLGIQISDSYTKLRPLSGNWLPVILNRMRPQIGPLVLNDQANPADLIRGSDQYMPQTNYILPSAYRELSLSWAATTILQFIGRLDLDLMNNIVEFDMSRLEVKKWPISL